MEMNSIPWSPVLRYATPLLINRTPVSTVALQHKFVSSVLQYARPPRCTGSHFERGRPNTRPFPPFCGMPGLVSIAYSIQALPVSMTTHSVPTQPVGSHAFCCLPMNTTHSVASP